MLGVSRACPCFGVHEAWQLSTGPLPCRSNNWGQLGRGQASTDIASGLQPQYVDMPADVIFVWVAAYNAFTLAMAASGNLYCFG